MGNGNTGFGGIDRDAYIRVGQTMVDVANYGDDIAAAVAAAPAGSAFWLEKPSYEPTAPIPYVAGNRFVGANAGLVVIKPGSGFSGSALFEASLASSGAITEVYWENLILDGVTGPTGTLDLIHLDTSTANNILYNRIKCENVTFRNARVGWWHAANNANAGPMNNGTQHRDCTFHNCLVGHLAGGVYGAEILDCTALQNTAAAYGTSGVGGINLGSGPTTFYNLSGGHIEGLGNLTGTGTATENGVNISASMFSVGGGLRISNISQVALSMNTAEDEGATIDNVLIYGTGYAPVEVSGVSSGSPLAISRVVADSILQNSSNAPIGAAFDLRSGSIQLTDSWIVGAQPPQAVYLGFGGAMDSVTIERVVCSPTVSWIGISTQPTYLHIKDCPGYNPVGSSVPGTAFSIAASGSDWTNDTGVDGTLYCTAAGTVTAVRVNGVSVSGSLGVGDTFPVPAGGKWGYTGTAAPTMVFVGN